MRSQGLRRYAKLRASKGLRRTWIKRRSPRRIARETPEERNHKAMIRQAGVCSAAKYVGAGKCFGGLEIAHLGLSGGIGRKHGDWTQTTLLCNRHHTDLDRRTGPLGSMSADERAMWLDREIALARAFVAGILVVAA